MNIGELIECLEIDIRQLKKQVATKDRRIQELEKLVLEKESNSA